MGHKIDMKNEPIHTDLAIELTKNEVRSNIDGIKITDINLSKEEAKKINKKEGNYITIEFDDITDYASRKKVKTVFSKELKKIIVDNNVKKDDLCLIIGLGNDKSTPDSLGPLTISKVLVAPLVILILSKEPSFWVNKYPSQRAISSSLSSKVRVLSFLPLLLSNTACVLLPLSERWDTAILSSPKE